MNETAIAEPMKKDNSRVLASHHDLESWGHSDSPPHQVDGVA